ncbi:(deoxy)nucleoside triphosphate pyrophosphohydrolase [Cetobacterium sp. 2A]|uniref:(deoxy)nucleoside triphosphate pyrophosphohydrolase n=1 Tax=Cetobacterium sp. 2A TaxID=2754723 RepID=UPI00163B627F|nr:(deoxy)nucleoside triphosphate pyrophosphohydrolase [Cetobacterium sp. 2A]MBC2856045.1 (deoxy)nucleoside triphosphate pyrophosphohydrolase [Cetobacterium sp. 2A]
MKKEINVAAAIIKDHSGKILCTLRKNSNPLGNFWEFPGGKIEKDETSFEAIEREIYEELNLKVVAKNTYMKNTHEYKEVIVNLILIECDVLEGTIILNDHSAFLWLKTENLSSLVWAPADIPAVKKLMS